MFKNGWMHFYWSVQYTSKLDDQQQFRLNKINEVKDYFVAEIKGTELMSKGLVNILLLVTILINF